MKVDIPGEILKHAECKRRVTIVHCEAICKVKASDDNYCDGMKEIATISF